MTEKTFEMSIEQYEPKGGSFRRGDVVEGTIVGRNSEGWLVDFGYKTEGVIPDSEWTRKFLLDDVEPKKDVKVKAFILSMGQEDEQLPKLSRWRVIFEERWNEFENSLKENNEVITVRGIESTKGGLVVDCFKLRGFVPMSHLTLPDHSVSMRKFLNKEFKVKLLEKNKRKKSIKLSHRLVLEEEIKRKKEEFFNSINEGDIIEGKVVGITKFGVFVNIGPIDGRVPLNELSYGRVVNPRDVVRRGKKVKVKILSIDKEQERVTLSIKQTQPDPWESVGEKYKVGDVVEGKVTGLTDFGAFVELEPGVEGLIRLSSLSWERINHPKDILRLGQKVKVLIKEIDIENKRISLGYKELNDPWQEIDQKYKVGDIVTVKIKRIKDFGAFVELEPGVEGLLHVSQMDIKKVSNPAELFSPGDEVTCKILKIDKENRQIRLSRRVILEEEERKRREEEERRRKQEMEKQKAMYQEDIKITLGDLLVDKIPLSELK